MNETKFNTDKNVLTVTRTFNAPVELVWRAWTEAELLDQWWAPEPWKSVTKSMDFQSGGTRLYAMVGPDGSEHWGKTLYDTIDTHDSFNGSDAFCDKDGVVNESFPVSRFGVQFNDESEQTTVVMVTEYATEAQLQQVVEMGMIEGLTMTLNQLETLLSTVNA